MKKVKAMNVTTYTQFRQNLKSELDTIIRMHQPLQVHRSNGEDVIVISKEDFNSMEETFHLLKSPANAKRLMEAIEEYNSGTRTERKLME